MIKQSPNKRKSEVGAVTTPKKQKLDVENGKTPLKTLANTPKSGKKGGNKTPNAANNNKSPNQTPGKQNNQVKTPGKQNHQQKSPGNYVKAPGQQNDQVKSPGNKNNQVKTPGKPGKKLGKNNKESPKIEAADDSPKKLQKFDGRNNLELTLDQRTQKQLKQEDEDAEIIAKRLNTNEDDEDDDEEDDDDEDDDEGDDNEGDDEDDAEGDNDEGDDNDEDDADVDDADDSIDEAKDKLATKKKVNNVQGPKKWKYKLFVSNLPNGATKETITAHFKKVCKVIDVKNPIDRSTGKPRKFAFLEVADIKHYNKAMSLHRSFLDGRQINVLLYNNNKAAVSTYGIKHKNSKFIPKQRCVCGGIPRKYDKKPVE